ncbi:MAG: tRNA lysidine(34) synthetase TilS [Chloroflexi bacterium]|nr:tRNA lysidine(34) synthetase TilS [Chloroflexota bacterium]
MLTTVLRVIRQQRLIPPGCTVVVGISGGADSLAQLHILRELAPRCRFRLHAATLDHHLRGEAGAADVRFVQDIARLWDIPLTTGHADVLALARRNGLSIEAAARQARYDFLAQTARAVGADRVAVAHHADDQAETVLMHLLRGAGLAGLSGMAARAPLPGHPDLTLIRPLLTITRAEIEDYCRRHDLHPRQDTTNQDVTYLRNAIRLQTLPHLERLNPGIRRALVQLADIAAAEDDLLTGQVRQTVSQGGVSVEDGRVNIERRRFAALHPALQRRLLAWAVEQAAGSRLDIAYIHIVQAVEVARRGRLGALALLPDGWRLRVDYEMLVIERADAPLPTRQPMPLLETGSQITVTIPGETALPGGWRLIAGQLPHESGKRLVVPDGAPVLLRSRRPGDRFAPPGLGGHTQKLSRWMVNRKIPEHLRDRLPLLVVNGQIAAVIVGETWTISAGFAAPGEDTPGVCFHFRQFPQP